MITFLVYVAIYFVIGIIPTLFITCYGMAISRGTIIWGKAVVFGVIMWVLWPIAIVNFLRGK